MGKKKLDQSDKAKASRADRLHEQIEELTRPPEESEAGESRRKAPRVISPREFIQKRMRELDRDQKG